MDDYVTLVRGAFERILADAPEPPDLDGLELVTLRERTTPRPRRGPAVALVAAAAVLLAVGSAILLRAESPRAPVATEGGTTTPGPSPAGGPDAVDVAVLVAPRVDLRVWRVDFASGPVEEPISEVVAVSADEGRRLAKAWLTDDPGAIALLDTDPGLVPGIVMLRDLREPLVEPLVAAVTGRRELPVEITIEVRDGRGFRPLGGADLVGIAVGDAPRFFADVAVPGEATRLRSWIVTRIADEVTGRAGVVTPGELAAARRLGIEQTGRSDLDAQAWRGVVEETCAEIDDESSLRALAEWLAGESVEVEEARGALRQIVFLACREAIPWRDLPVADPLRLSVPVSGFDPDAAAALPVLAAEPPPSSTPPAGPCCARGPLGDGVPLRAEDLTPQLVAAVRRATSGLLEELDAPPPYVAHPAFRRDGEVWVVVSFGEGGTAVLVLDDNGSWTEAGVVPEGTLLAVDLDGGRLRAVWAGLPGEARWSTLRMPRRGDDLELQPVLAGAAFFEVDVEPSDREATLEALDLDGNTVAEHRILLDLFRDEVPADG